MARRGRALHNDNNDNDLAEVVERAIMKKMNCVNIDMETRPSKYSSGPVYYS